MLYSIKHDLYFPYEDNIYGAHHVKELLWISDLTQCLGKNCNVIHLIHDFCNKEHIAK